MDGNCNVESGLLVASEQVSFPVSCTWMACPSTRSPQLHLCCQVIPSVTVAASGRGGGHLCRPTCSPDCFSSSVDRECLHKAWSLICTPESQSRISIHRGSIPGYASVRRTFLGRCEQVRKSLDRSKTRFHLGPVGESLIYCGYLQECSDQNISISQTSPAQDG